MPSSLGAVAVRDNATASPQHVLASLSIVGMLQQELRKTVKYALGIAGAVGLAALASSGHELHQ